MFQHGFRLLTGNAGEPLQKIVQPRAVFEVLEERLHRHPRARKHPSTAYLAGHLLNPRAFMPVHHGFTLRRPFDGGNACLARPLKRAIQDKLLNPLAQRLLASDLQPGDTVKVGAGREDELEFAKG